MLKVGKLVVEKDDVGSGLIELIDVHGVRNLVMGAAADRHYTRYTLCIHIIPLNKIRFF